MAIVQITTLEFVNDDGKTVPYKRLTITGYIGGEIQTLELKLSPTELLLAGMLLKSTEEKPVQSVRKATEDESPKAQHAHTSILDDDEDLGDFLQ